MNLTELKLDLLKLKAQLLLAKGNWGHKGRPGMIGGSGGGSGGGGSGMLSTSINSTPIKASQRFMETESIQIQELLSEGTKGTVESKYWNGELQVESKALVRSGVNFLYSGNEFVKQTKKEKMADYVRFKENTDTFLSNNNFILSGEEFYINTKNNVIAKRMAGNTQLLVDFSRVIE